MRLALAQLNPTVGDVRGNTRLVLDAMERADRDGADLLVTSELALIGYPPRDLLFRDGVVEACEDAVRTIASAAGPGLTVIVGHPRRADGGGRPLRNSASICRDGEIVGVYDKRLLPGYDVFDEDRYFEPGTEPCVVQIAGRRVGVLICEDLWRARDAAVDRDYVHRPIRDVVALGAEIVVSLNATPFIAGKWQRHLDQMQTLAGELGVALAAVHQVGANDDLVFDGRSVVVDHRGRVNLIAAGFEAAIVSVDLDDPPVVTPPTVDTLAETFDALVLGTREYFRKSGHREALIGLSGGIDSAVTAVIAHAALPGGLRPLMLPSRYSSAGARDDAIALADALGVACGAVSIEAAHDAVASTLRDELDDRAGGVVDENVQARLRGLILMAMTNATGALLLATSNKSELAVGYSTLYGDMCGAVSVIGDLTKTRVYELARWINANPGCCRCASPPIPESSITKPPSAELRPDQTDQDTLPPYDVLDRIVECFVELEQAPDRIARETGIDEQLVRRWTTAIDRAQYKRDQSSVIFKVTPRTFGRGRVMPIVMKSQNVETSQSQNAQVR